MKNHINSRVYESDEARHELLKKTADILSDYAFALSSCSWRYGSAALDECEHQVAIVAQEYLNYFFAKESNMR